jgi:hydroxyethylthiazole kinase
MCHVVARLDRGGNALDGAAPNLRKPCFMMSHASLAITRHALRARAPLVHNLTSAVVANFTANVLLAIGASPAMVESADEVEDFVAMSDALVINLGTRTLPQSQIMLSAVAAARRTATPWVLDPVGVGAIKPRTAFARVLCDIGPTAIRGNASEIMGLVGEEGHGRGVDTGIGSDKAIDAAKSLARSTGAIVAVTGAIDYVTDGNDVVAVAHGHPMMTRVTGMGCAATAIVAACLAVEPDRLRAVAHALAFNGIAGEIAAARADGPGSLAMHYLDALAGDLSLTLP